MKHFIFFFSLFMAQSAAAQIISHKLVMHSKDTQCADSNNFCFTDSIFPFYDRCARATYLFSDGYKHEVLYPRNGPLNFCHRFQDPAGGRYSLTLELEDTQGFIIKQTFQYMTTIVCNTAVNSLAGAGGLTLSSGSDEGAWILSGEGLEHMQFTLTEISGRCLPLLYKLHPAGFMQFWIDVPGWYILSAVKNGKTVIREKLLRQGL